MPAIVYALTESKRKLSKEKAREGLLAGAAIGYLCKHNATLSGAEGGCQSEIGVASAMTAAFIAQVADSSPLVIENAAESALEHHLGMTCDPVAGYVQVPCIERCAFGAVKAWIACTDRDQRDREPASRGSRHHHHHPGPDRQGHGVEVQGNQRGRFGREPDPLLGSETIGMARRSGQPTGVPSHSQRNSNRRSRFMGQPETKDAWRGFNDGPWKREIDVRDFIVANVTPYTDGPEFLCRTVQADRRRLGQAPALLPRRGQEGRAGRGSEHAFVADFARAGLH